MEFTLISLLNGLSYGLLLFMLSSGLTLIFSMMGVLNFAHASFYMLGAIWLLLTRTRIGLVIQAALTHPEAVEALGHNVPRVFMGVFGGGCALAALAGVIGGNAFVTEPAMAATVGSIIFVVVVVGGMGSLGGALLASILIGMLQTFAVALDWSLLGPLGRLGISVPPDFFAYRLLSITLSEVAPILPYLLLVLVLILRPRGLLGQRAD